MNTIPGTEQKRYALIQARLRRGWTQADLAEKMGVATKTVARWEAGSTIPLPLYRAQVGKLLHIDPEEIWPLVMTFSAPSNSGERIVPLDQSLTLPIFSLPPLPEGMTFLTGREPLFVQVKTCLCSSTSSPVHVALYGLPGIGKTSLALALAHDTTLHQRFPDGILWAALGPQANVLHHLSRWGVLLGITQQVATAFRDEEAWAMAICDTIGMRRMLLIIDDPWDMATALNFQLGGPNCAYLLTTRFPELAHRFAVRHAFAVRELSQEESILLLSHLAPDVAVQEPQEMQELAQRVGGLPLALTLLGKHLQVQARSGQPRHLSAALQRLHSAEERLQLAEPQLLLERHVCLPAHAPLSLAAVIATSVQQLTEKAQQALTTLSVFPAKPSSFAEAAALSFEHISLDEIDQLLQAGLLESQSPGRYRLHQTIADHARLALHAQQGIFNAFHLLLSAITPLSPNGIATIQNSSQRKVPICSRRSKPHIQRGIIKSWLAVDAHWPIFC